MELSRWGNTGRNKGPIKCNFSKFLLSLERSYSDDAKLEAELAELNWLEPIMVTSEWTEPSYAGEEGRKTIQTWLQAPMEALIRLGNERLLALGLKEERLPERFGVFTDAEAGEAIGSYGVREPAWEKYAHEAFAAADADSCRKLLGWLGENARQKFHPRELGVSPLARLADACAAPRSRQEAALEAGLEQVEAWAAAWFDPKIKETQQERQERMRLEARARLLSIAAGKGNQTLCEILVDQGAPISSKAMMMAVRNGEPETFWILLKAARAHPERFELGELLAAKKQDREHWSERDAKEPEKGERLMVEVASLLGDRVVKESAERSLNSRGSSVSDFARERLAVFVFKALEDGLTRPGESSAQSRAARKKALGGLTRVASFLKDQKLFEALSAAEPEASAEELVALFEMGENERFKARALTLGGSKGAGKAARAEAAQGLLELCNATAARESSESRKRSLSKRWSAQSSASAIEMLAWIAARAPGIFPHERAAWEIARGAGLLRTGDLENATDEERKSRFEALVLAEQLEASTPGAAASKRGLRM